MAAGAILHQSLAALGCKEIRVYFLPKGENIHTPAASAALQELEPQSLIVLDQVLLHMDAQAVKPCATPSSTLLHMSPQ